MSEVSSNTKPDSLNSSAILEKGFFDLTPDEMEHLAQVAVSKAVERMHSQGIATITSVDGKMYQQSPDGQLEPYSVDLTKVDK
jgi:hypothetical protein